MNSILLQNIARNKNRKFCEEVISNSHKLKIDKTVSCYMTYHCAKCKFGKEYRSNPDLFLMEDRIFLVKVYRELYTEGRLSTRKLVKCEE
jgi:hypothetical protein